MLRYREFPEPNAFAQVVTPYLMHHEAAHCLLLGLSSTLIRPGSSYMGNNHLAAVAKNDAVVGALLMTPPFGPVISILNDPEAIDRFVAGLLPRQPDVPSIFGPSESSNAFAAAWTAATGEGAQVGFNEIIYQLNAVRRPPTPPGSFRSATIADRDLLLRWMNDFNAETFPPGSPEASRAAEAVNSRLRDPKSGFLIWEHDGPVALAGFCDPTPNGIRIGPVFTPVEHRGRGYASALTAEVAQQRLDSGRKFTFLFTDKSNGASNHVYRKIGFEPVTEFTLWTFNKPV